MNAEVGNIEESVNIPLNTANVYAKSCYCLLSFNRCIKWWSNSLRNAPFICKVRTYFLLQSPGADLFLHYFSSVARTLGWGEGHTVSLRVTWSWFGQSTSEPTSGWGSEVKGSWKDSDFARWTPTLGKVPQIKMHFTSMPFHYSVSHLQAHVPHFLDRHPKERKNIYPLFFTRLLLVRFVNDTFEDSKNEHSTF